MSKPKVLIIEDEHALQTVMSDRLEDEGFDVIEALDGREGLTKYNEYKPDVIILDILMPRYDGFHVLDALRKNEDHDVPIYVLTNFADAPSLNRIRDELKEYDELFIKTDKPLFEIIDDLKGLLQR